MTAPLSLALVRPPPTDCSEWERYGWRSQPDPTALAAEHEAFCDLLRGAGVGLLVAPATTLDAVYTYDPALVCDRGVVLLRPGKELRRGEPDDLADDLSRAVPIVARLEEPALAEGGDLAWLDGQTLLAGRGYRTNAAGIEVLRGLIGADLLAFDLPHLGGPGECLHLLSLLSLLADDLAVGYLPLLPVALVQLLAARGVRIVEVPDEELATLGPNVLALAPRVAVLPEQNAETRRRLERAGVDVLVYRAEELSKGDGGPTCLTLPLARG